MAIDVITLRGGLVDDAELRFTPSGAAVAEFRIAQSDNKLNEQTKQWDTIRALYLTCTIWDENPQYKQNPVQWAQIAAAQLSKGVRVSVRGKLHTEQWEDKQGNKRSATKFLVESFATEPDTRNQHQQGQQSAQGAGWNGQAQPQGGFGSQQNQAQGGFGGQQQNQQASNDPWNAPPPQGQGGFNGADDEPPF